MKTLTTVLTLLLSGLLPGCPQQDYRPRIVVRDTDQCLAAEARLEELQCKDLRGDPMWVNRRGERFSQTCEIAQEQGMIFLNPACIASAPDCAAADACPPSE